MINFRVIESPEPVRASNQKERRVIADVSEMFDSSITLYASTRVLYRENPKIIVEENKCKIIDQKRWRVNMAYPLDRAGIQQFKSVPFDILTKFWQKTINIKEADISTKGSNIFKFDNEDYFGRSISCYFLWNEIGSSPTNPTLDISVNKDKSESALKWMFEHSPEIIPFTDGDTMFLDPATEVAYISDLMG